MSGPLVSVLIPCFNAEKWVGETIQSICAQTWRDLEIVVVDDGSMDDSCRVVENFPDPRIRLIRQKNAGAAAARNRAAAEARGDYFQFLDADDLLDPEKIARQMHRLGETRGAVACAAWARFVHDPVEAKFVENGLWADLPPLDWLIENVRSGGEMLFPAMWLIPREVAAVAGPWNERLTVNDDGEYFTRVVLASRTVVFAAGAKCYYRSGIPGSLSGQKNRHAWDSQFRVQELYDEYWLGAENSERTRRIRSLAWQRLAHACYPYHRDIAETAWRKGGALHGDRVRPEGGWMYRVLASILGWRIARDLQRLSGRP